MRTLFRVRTFFVATAVLIFAGAVGIAASASHSWGGYHWARIGNPFTLKLGDNVSGVWDTHLPITSNDWSQSNVLDTTITPGLTNPKNCRAVKGRVEVCNSTYGNNGWLGLAQIWVSGNHIVQGVAKLNDTYFNLSNYNTPAWRNLVMCQEVGHTFGLGHQDENSGNLNLGTCMDYTNDPARNDGFGDNQHPNTHDYDQLATIYTHFDSFTTILSKTFSTGASKAAHAVDIDTSNPKEWGRAVKKDARGKNSLYERDLGNGEKLFTFVTWAD